MGPIIRTKSSNTKFLSLSLEVRMLYPMGKHLQTHLLLEYLKYLILTLNLTKVIIIYLDPCWLNIGRVGKHNTKNQMLVSLVREY